jgi:hypothetical protein
MPFDEAWRSAQKKQPKSYIPIAIKRFARSNEGEIMAVRDRVVCGCIHIRDHIRPMLF